IKCRKGFSPELMFHHSSRLKPLLQLSIATKFAPTENLAHWRARLLGGRGSCRADKSENFRLTRMFALPSGKNFSAHLEVRPPKRVPYSLRLKLLLQ
ncbi:MAG: hypothetical protein ACK40X_02780, partial [Armatimonadota bacterium]